MEYTYMNKKDCHKIVNALSYIYIAPNRDDVTYRRREQPHGWGVTGTVTPNDMLQLQLLSKRLANNF